MVPIPYVFYWNFLQYPYLMRDIGTTPLKGVFYVFCIIFKDICPVSRIKMADNLQETVHCRINVRFTGKCLNALHQGFLHGKTVGNAVEFFFLGCDIARNFEPAVLPLEHNQDICNIKPHLKLPIIVLPLIWPARFQFAVCTEGADIVQALNQLVTFFPVGVPHILKPVQGGCCLSHIQYFIGGRIRSIRHQFLLVNHKSFKKSFSHSIPPKYHPSASARCMDSHINFLQRLDIFRFPGQGCQNSKAWPYGRSFPHSPHYGYPQQKHRPSWQ